MALSVQVTVCGVVCVLQYCKGWNDVGLYMFVLGVFACLLHLMWWPFMVDMLRQVAQIATLVHDPHCFPTLTTGCSLVRNTELRATYRTAPAGKTSGVYNIDKFFKEELQTIFISIYRVIEWWSLKAFRRLRSCASNARCSWWRILCILSAKDNAWSCTFPPPYASWRSA